MAATCGCSGVGDGDWVFTEICSIKELAEWAKQ